VSARGSTVPLWEHRPVAAWQAEWQLPLLEIHDLITSTSDRARRLAAAGAPAGTLVMAERQSAGRGRHGRAWHAPYASSLLLSFLLRPRPGRAAPPETRAAPGTTPLRVGMAIADAIAAVTGIECRMKWPNDLIVPGRGKVAGILCEAVSTGQIGSYIVAGIGINVRQRAADWPAELRDTATSLDECAGVRVARPALAGAVVDALRPLFHASALPLSVDELAVFERRDALLGCTVVLDHGTTAIARGLDPDGALIVEGADGVRRVTAAVLRLTGASGTAS
jgi:BirA family transcriptional regulator, biotin operon repressor / biotin---[acetyl-CoA-carboxylase] ligase